MMPEIHKALEDIAAIQNEENSPEEISELLGDAIRWLKAAQAKIEVQMLQSFCAKNGIETRR